MLAAPAMAGVPADLKINEVESDAPGGASDFVELYNSSATPTDAGGLVLKDNGDGNTSTIPGPSTIAAGGYLTIDVSGLGPSDSARLFASDGTTLIDSYTWTAHAETTYGRCPTGSGPFVTTDFVTRNAANACGGGSAWPGGQTVAFADVAGTFTGNISGLDYEGSGSALPGVLWVVNNNPGTLYRMVPNGSGQWVNDTTNGWAAGKRLRWPENGAADNVDSEGVTMTAAGSAGGMFVSTERDNDAGGNRLSVLRFDVTGAGAPLVATREWNLTTDLPAVPTNAGLESVAWVPDSYLTGKGFVTSGGTIYNPADYPGHGAGLFLVGLEDNGQVYAYALDQGSPAFTRVATFASGFPTFAALHWETEKQQLWTVCDNNCRGISHLFEVDAAAGAMQGKFKQVASYLRPTGMANLNNEGFAITPQAECSGASLKPAFWADDGNTDGHSLRTGPLSCTPAAATPTPTPTATVAPKTSSTTTVAVKPDTVTAAVSPNNATGTVAFTVDGAPVGSAPLGGGVATLADKVPSGGDRAVVATYAGDGSFTGSSGSVVRRDPIVTLTRSSAMGPNGAGWYRTAVTLMFTCTATSAPVDCPEPIVVREDTGIDAFATDVFATDGGKANVGDVGLKVDLAKPTVAIAGVKRNKTYKKAPKAKCRATDKTSGIASCKLRTVKGRKGRRTVTATARDNADNVAKRSVKYRVR